MSIFQTEDLFEIGSWNRQREKKIARITSMFQSGIVSLGVAKAAICKLSQNEDVLEIETTRLAVSPLANVSFDREIRQAIEQAEADRVKAQGMTPRAKPAILPED